MPEENNTNDHLQEEELDLEEGLGSLYSEFRQEQEETQDLASFYEESDDEKEASEPVRREPPRFGTLKDDEEPPTVGDFVENVFENDGAGDSETPDTSKKSKKGFWSEIKNIAREEWNKDEEQKDKKKKPKKKQEEKQENKKPKEKGAKKSFSSFGDRLKEKGIEKQRAIKEVRKQKDAKTPTAEQAPQPTEKAPEHDLAPEQEDSDLAPSLGVTLEENDNNFIDLIRSRLNTIQKIKKKESKAQTTGPRGAGLDISPPQTGINAFINRLQGKKSFSTVAEPSKSDFEKLLTPLSGSEIAILQAEVAADDTVFQRIDHSRQTASRRQQMGFMVALLTLALFVYGVGESYFTTILADAVQPSWIPDAIKGSIAGSLLYALGILFPILVVLIVTNSVRLLINAVTDLRVDDLLLGLSYAVCAIGVLVSCSEGQIIGAGLFLIAYFLIMFTARLLKVGKK